MEILERKSDALHLVQDKERGSKTVSCSSEALWGSESIGSVSVYNTHLILSDVIFTVLFHTSILSLDILDKREKNRLV